MWPTGAEKTLPVGKSLTFLSRCQPIQNLLTTYDMLVHYMHLAALDFKLCVYDFFDMQVGDHMHIFRCWRSHPILHNQRLHIILFGSHWRMNVFTFHPDVVHRQE